MDLIILLKETIRHKKGAFLSIMILMMIIATSLTTVITTKENQHAYLKEAVERVKLGDLVLFLDDQFYSEESFQKATQLKECEGYRDDPIICAVRTTINGVEDEEPLFLAPYKEEDNLYAVFNQKATAYVTHPENLKQGEIYAPIAFKSMFQCKIGSKIEAETNHGVEEFTIKGFYEEPFIGAYVIGVKQVLISKEDYNRLTEYQLDLETSVYPCMIQYHLVHLFLNDEGNHSIEDMKKLINEQTGIIDESFTTMSKKDSMGYTLMVTDIYGDILSVFVLLLTIIVLIVLAHSIYTGIEMDYVNLGVLKSQGFTKGRLRCFISLQYLIAQILGAVIGIFCSIPLIRLLGRLFYPITGVLASLHLSVLNSLAAIMAIIIFCTIFVFYLTERVSSISPIRAISGGQSSVYFHSRIHIKINHRALSVKLALRQCSTNLKQYVGIVLIGSILMYFMVSITILSNCMTSETMMNTFGKILYDIELRMNNKFTVSDIDRMEEDLQQKECVCNLVFDRKIYVCTDEYETKAIIYDEPEEFKSIIIGREPLYENEIVITDSVSNYIGKKTGDIVSVSYMGKKVEYLISGIFQTTIDAGNCIGLTLSASNRLADIIPYYGYVRISDASQVNDMVDYINQNYGDILKAKAEDEANTLTTLIQTTLDAVTNIIYMISVLFILVVVKMVCGRSFLKEKQDIGIYKAIGFSTTKLRTLFAIRFFLLSILGIIFGFILCLLYNNKMMSMLLSAMGISNFTTSYTMRIFMIPGVLIGSCFFLFSYLSARSIKKVEVKELITE